MASVVGTMLSAFFHLAFVMILHVSANTGGVRSVRGVELKLQPYYPTNQDFTCLDGSKTIPFNSVNDDYCDCADGTDEPGTSACPEGRYYCFNIGYKAKYIPSSRVNDGICDCCDGSDEHDSDVACFNECEKFGLAEMELRKEEMAESIEGSKIKNEYVHTGKERKENKKTRIETINGLLVERIRELQEARAARESAEAPEKEAKERHDKEWDEMQQKLKAEKNVEERNTAFDLLDTDRDGWISIAELQSHNQESDMTETEAKDLLGGETMVDREGLVNVWSSIKPKIVKISRPDPSQFDKSNTDDKPPEPEVKDKPEDAKKASELTDDIALKSDSGDKMSKVDDEAKEMKKIIDDDDDIDDEDHNRDIYKSAETDVHESGDEADDEDDEDDKDDKDDKDDHEGDRHEDTKNKSDRPDYDEGIKQLIEVADRARENYDSIDKSVKDLEREKKDLEDYLGIDFGNNEEFSALKGECYEYTDREYVYKLCPFERVTQRNKDGGMSETDLGNKMSWKGAEPNRFSVMKYEGGQACWNGPTRSMTVYLSCGKENIVTSVSEPSRCEYEMNFKTPALCEHIEHDEL